MACSECNERIGRMATYIEDLRRLREGELAAAERLRGEVEGARERLLGLFPESVGEDLADLIGHVEDARDRLKALFPDAETGKGSLEAWIAVVEGAIE